MFDIIRPKSKTILDVKEFCDQVEKEIDLSDHESLREASELMNGLYQNKNLLENLILEEMKSNFKNFQGHNSYTPPSLILEKREKFFIRANVWMPDIQEIEGNVNVYGLLHDHNFDFLTLNYFGPGYQSQMYEYCYDDVEGRVGEKVDLKYKGILSLKEGESFLYRKGVDVHAQKAPEELSVTLNLMVAHSSLHLKRQYIFDPETHCIQRVRGELQNQKFMIDLALSLGGEDSKDLLWDLKDRGSVEVKEYLQTKLV